MKISTFALAFFSSVAAADHQLIRNGVKKTSFPKHDPTNIQNKNNNNNNNKATISTEKIPHRSLGNGQCGSKLLHVKFTNDFSFVYNDRGTGANHDFGVWRPNNEEENGWYRLGDVGLTRHGPGPKTALLIKDDLQLLTKPSGYQLVWKDSGSGGSMDSSFWEPIPPSGYTCLGHVVMPHYGEPSTNLIRCVKDEYVIQVGKKWVWDDRGSGADWDASVYEATPFENTPALIANTFITRRSHSAPADENFKGLNMNCVEGDGYAMVPSGYQEDPSSYESIAKQLAPMIYLHSAEKYFPSSVEYFLANTHIEGGYMVTNEDLGCSTCTDPTFLDGIIPQDGNTPPIYAIAVPKGSTNAGLVVVDVVYFLFFPYNAGKDVCIGFEVFGSCVGDWSNFGNHVGDWEHLTIRFIDGHPHQIYISTHDAGTAYLWGDKRIEFLKDSRRPVAYSARGSHGLYAFEGSYHYKTAWTTPLVDLMNGGIAWDATNGDNVKFTEHHEIGDYDSNGEWSFLNLPQRWGNPPRDCYAIADDNCLLEAGPESPSVRDFTNPSVFELS